MSLDLADDFTRDLLTKAAKDDDLARSLARKLVAQTDPTALASLLLTDEVAAELVFKRLREAPEDTLRELDGVRANNQPKKRGRPRKATARAASPKTRKAKVRRLTADESETIKQKIRTLLGKGTPVGKGQILKATGPLSQGVYNRIMRELLDAGEMTKKGEKAKTVYSSKPKKKATTRKKTTSKKAPRKKTKK